MQGTGLVLLTAGLVLGTAGVAGAKNVSDKKYAKTICGAITGVSDTIDQIQPANSGDPATAQTQILTSTDQLLASLNEAKAKAAKLSPSDGGKKVTKLFDAYFQSSVDGVTTRARSSLPPIRTTWPSRLTSRSSRQRCRPWKPRPAIPSPSCRRTRTSCRR